MQIKRPQAIAESMKVQYKDDDTTADDTVHQTGDLVRITVMAVVKRLVTNGRLNRRFTGVFRTETDKKTVILMIGKRMKVFE